MIKYIIAAIALALAPATGHAGELPEPAKQAMRDALRQRLIDPDSARFRWLPRTEAETVVVYCGYVNSKNRMGGYSGFVPFSAFLLGPDGGWRATVIDIGATPDDLELVEVMCNHGGYNLVAPTTRDVP